MSSLDWVAVDPPDSLPPSRPEGSVVDRPRLLRGWRSVVETLRYLGAVRLPAGAAGAVAVGRALLVLSATAALGFLTPSYPEAAP